MIQILRNQLPIPASLNSDLTNQRRQELIDRNAYPTEKERKKFDDRYKQSDVKEALETSSKSKCMYCESSIRNENWPVEHYRPKVKYPWLVYSWDNLLASCSKCNSNFKGDKFELRGKQIQAPRQGDLEKIHELVLEYSVLEEPLHIHPVLENVEKHFEFNELGEVASQEARVKYTIETCGLDRPNLRKERKKILDELKEKLHEQWCIFDARKDKQKKKEALTVIRFIIEEFYKKAQNKEQSYLTYRRWLLAHPELWFRTQPSEKPESKLLLAVIRKYLAEIEKYWLPNLLTDRDLHWQKPCFLE